VRDRHVLSRYFRTDARRSQQARTTPDAILSSASGVEKLTGLQRAGGLNADSIDGRARYAALADGSANTA
jgi:hypothetical protein